MGMGSKGALAECQEFFIQHTNTLTLTDKQNKHSFKFFVLCFLVVF